MGFKVSPTLLVQRIDHEALALDLAKDTYFEINHTGLFVLERLRLNAPPHEIIAEIANCFGQDSRRVSADVYSNIRQLLELGLVFDDGSP